MPFLLEQSGHVLLWGALATAVLTLIMSASQGLGWSRMSLPYMIGTLFTPHRGQAMIVGFGVHFVLGVVIAALYALVFDDWGRATVWLGALLGLLHGLFMLIPGMQLLPAIHPRMASRHHGPTPTRQLEPPGFMALNYGAQTPLVTLAAHVVYGAILGGFLGVA
jgi:hypothetical protein